MSIVTIEQDKLEEITRTIIANINKKDSIIGKKYRCHDNSYEINLTEHEDYQKEYSKNRKYPALKNLECTILTEPFIIKKRIRSNSVARELNMPSHKQVKMVVVNCEGDALMLMYHETGVIKE